MTGAAFHKGASAQDIETPQIFIDAVEQRFGKLSVDLAATWQNTKALQWIAPEHNSLTHDWKVYGPGPAWLNPPFGDIASWAAKCADCRDLKRWTLLLVPASTGANWFSQIVVPNAFVLYLTQRITFVGQKHGFPKDLALCCFGFGMTGSAFWRWNTLIKTKNLIK